MLSFHNDQSIKAKYLSRVRRHQKADNLMQGIGWNQGKGGAVGCTLQNYDNSRYPIELGLPEWLARLEDIIFNNLPIEEANLFPEKLLEAISVGVDVEIVRHKISIKRMNRLLKIQKEKLGKNGEEIDKILIQTISSIELVKKCHEEKINENDSDWDTAYASASAAESAANSAAKSAAVFAYKSAKYAGYAGYAGYAVFAVFAGYAAKSAESAAESAKYAAYAECAESDAESAESAAYAKSALRAGRASAWKQEADDLIEALKNCK